MAKLRLGPRGADIVGFIAIPVVMGCVMSAAMTALNVGFGANFLSAWLRGWAVGALVGAPTGALMIPPLMRWLTLLRDEKTQRAATKPE